MANAHVLISSQTLGSAVASVTFGSGGTLSQTYRDLILVINATLNTSSQALRIYPNGDTANASQVFMYGNGSTAASSTASTIDAFYSDTVLPNISRVNIMDYSQTDKHKTFLIRFDNANSGGFTMAEAARWASTTAITSLTLTASSGTIAVGSTFYLYGVLA